MPRSAAARADAGGRTSVEKGRGSAQCGSANLAKGGVRAQKATAGKKAAARAKRRGRRFLCRGQRAARADGDGLSPENGAVREPDAAKGDGKGGRRTPEPGRIPAGARGGSPPEAGAGSRLRMLRGENPRRKQAPRCATLPCAFSRLRKECRREWSRDWAGSPAHRRPPSPRAARHPRPCTLRGSCRTRRRKWRTRPRQ